MSFRQNRFFEFNQRELEIIELALVQLAEEEFLPQHRHAMSEMREALFQEVSAPQTAPCTDDGSHFGNRP